MNDIAAQSHTQQQLYWQEIIKLKVASLYICRYRDHLGRWVTGLGVLKAIAIERQHCCLGNLAEVFFYLGFCNRNFANR